MMRDVRAVLLAGGLGTRMKELTEGRPKPLVPFGGQCHLVDFSIANAVRSGLDQIVLLSSHGERQLIRYLVDTWDGSGEFRVHFGRHEKALREGRAPADLPSLSPERGTADALVKNAEYVFGEDHRDVLVLHADHVYDFDYTRMLAYHRSSRAALTISYQAIQREHVKLFGMVEFDDNDRLRRFVEKPDEPTSNLVFAAFCLFDKAVLARYLDQLKDTDWAYDISRDVIPAMLANGEPIAGFPVDGYWEDIGTVDRYHRAHLRLLGPHPTLRPARMPRTLSPGVPRRKADSERGLRDVLLAEDLVNHGVIERSVVYPRVRVGRNAHVRNAILLPGARVGNEVVVDGAIVLDGETVTANRNCR